MSYVDRLFAPVSGASLGVFRAGFGLLASWHVLRMLQAGEFEREYAGVTIAFKYPWLGWVQALEPTQMRAFGWGLVGLGLLVATGLGSRLAVFAFGLGYSYVFALEATAYQNHCYLLCLLSGLLCTCGPHRAFSLDQRASIHAAIPKWTLLVVQFQLGVPYIYGGLAKLDTDWLLRAQPMTMWLRELSGGRLDGSVSAYVISWGGLLFDLSIVPALLWSKTRVVALIAAACFHMFNAMLFQIGVFPWLMLWANLLFLPADWPLRLVEAVHRTDDADAPRSTPEASQPRHWRVVTVGLLALYAAFQLGFPLRHHFIAGNASWTEEGHDFAWRMKLRDKRGDVVFTVYDEALDRFVELAGVRSWLTARQWSGLVHDPEVMRQMAHAIAARMPGRPRVRVLSSVSLNGRPPQRIVDPDVDLSRQAWQLRHAPWIVPLDGAGSEVIAGAAVRTPAR